MLKTMVLSSEDRGLHPTPTRFLLGLLSFTQTWTLIPTAAEGIPYLHQHGHPPLTIGNLLGSVYLLEFIYILPGLVLALLFFGCLSLWFRRQPNKSGWLKSACLVSLTLALLETGLGLLFFSDGNIAAGWTRYTLGFLVSFVSGLFLSGVLSASFWAAPIEN